MYVLSLSVSRLYKPPHLHPQTHEAYLDKWEIVKLTHTRMSVEEAEEREEVLAEVMDPVYLMGRDADADGEAEVESEGVFGTAVDDDKGLDLGLGLGGGGSEEEGMNGIGLGDDVKDDLKPIVDGGGVGGGEMVDVMEV